MTYTIYSQSTGQILRIVQTDDIDAQLQSGEQYVDGAIDDAAFYMENGTPVAIPPKPASYDVFDYTTKQWVQSTDLATSVALLKRQRILYASDWTQIPNNPLPTAKQTEWATYRQALRDITQQAGYPFNILWPTPPASS